jgi:hypothetical protein
MSTPFSSTPLGVLLAGRPDRRDLLKDFGLSLRVEDRRQTLRECCSARGIDVSSVAFALWAAERVRDGQRQSA